MSETKNIDFLIIGQGIAGTILAHKLLEKGNTIQLIDNGHKSSSSMIAGGVTHPMSFKRIILSWKADTLIPIAKTFYRKFEKQHNSKVFYDLTMTRIFSSIEEQNNWQGRMADPPLKQIVKDGNNGINKEIKASFGTGSVNLAGRLDVAAFLSISKSYFKEHSILENECFDFSKLTILDDSVKYRRVKAKRIIFCEGYKFCENPYFDYIPFNFTKGEILILKTKHLPKTILSQGCFVMPIGDEKYVLGATYDRENINQQTTKEAKGELIDKIKAIGDFKFEIIEQRAGVRPTTHDRRPIIGKHPKFSNVIIFNGLGSKGVMLAPHFADELVSNLETNSPLNSEVDVARYSKKHLHKCSL